MVWDHFSHLRFPFQALGREVCPLQKGTPTRSQECPSDGTEGSEDTHHAKSEKEGKHHFQWKLPNWTLFINTLCDSVQSLVSILLIITC